MMDEAFEEMWDSAAASDQPVRQVKRAEGGLQWDPGRGRVRRAIVRGKAYGARTLAESILPYMPSNYSVLVDTETDSDLGSGLQVTIEGRDVAGWTLDGYVLPRLASGMYYGVEYFGEYDSETS